jgi:hypothetical protein
MSLTTGSASAAIGEPLKLWTECEFGSGAGQCNLPRGIAASPDSGHVFIADLGSYRIVEFTAAGGFVKTWGWDVVASGPGDTGVAFEICIPGRGDTCKAGISGAGVGQFNLGVDVAVDSTGGVYVVDFSNRRVQKFDSEGNFVLMFGGNVNQTKVGEGAPESERNRCPVDPGDVCQAGTTGPGQGEFGAWVLGSFITIDPTDKVYVGDENRIQRFNAAGVYQDEISLVGETVQGLASDSSGNLYAIYQGKPDVRKITPSGEELESPRFKISTPEGPAIPTAVAVDPVGDVYVFGPTTFSGGTQLDPIWKFDSSGNVIANFGKGEFNASTGLATNLCPGNESPGNLYVSNFDFAFNHDFVRAYGTPPINCGKAITGKATNISETSATLNGEANPKGLAVSECFFEYGTTITYGQTKPCVESAGEIGTGSDPVTVHADVDGLTAGTVYHFRLVVGTASGTEEGGDETFKTLGPPVISAEHTVGVNDTQATAKALVNPEGLATSCHFEYGTTEAYGQSTEDQPVGGDRKEHAVQATLEGLAPATTYHWQIVCLNSSDEIKGQDQAFTTFPTAPIEPDTCPNAALRSGAAAFLPDCRAYEMVSPVDKNGGDIIISGRYVIQVSPDGERIAYETLPSFAGQPSNISPNQYLATRDADSWSSEGNHPPISGETTPGVQFGYAREYIAFSPDLCSSWLVDYQTPSAAADGQLGYRNLIRRQNCAPGIGGLEALTPEPPVLPPGTPDAYVTTESVQGYSDDASHQVFVANVALPHTPEAAPGTSAQIYDRFEGELSVVSILPGGLADGAGARVGSGWNANLQNAVSKDGSRVYWTSGTGGKIYLRSHPEQGVVADECTEPSKACTVAVSPTGNALFWAASSDGSKALYSEGNLSTGEAKLYEFEQGAPERRQIAKNVYGVLGNADDLSHVYFVSTDALPAAGPNSEEEEAVAGEPNLYLDQEGTLAFVGTLSEKDLGGTEPGAIAEGYDLVSLSSRQRSTRVSPDGEHIAFQSRAPLTGFDNTDASGKPAVEVFTYEAGGELHCVSCNPSGAQPQTEELLPPFVARWARDPSKTLIRVAAWIPGWERALYDSKVLSDSGGRLFFNSYDALLPRDGNGEMDVYEWEAPGEGSCTSKSSAFHASNGGCIYLISTGESPFESEFWGASPDGEDVFFITESSLVPQDPGLVDLYDARVGGGFPAPEAQADCEGEACQSAAPAPQFSTPGSSSFSGPGNLAAKPKPRKCPKGKRRVTRKGKSRCVKRKAGKQGNRRRAGANRRAAR